MMLSQLGIGRLDGWSLRRAGWCAILAAAMVAVMPDLATGQWVQNPANGHFYRLTEGRYWGVADEYPNENQPDWFDAEAEAQSYGSTAHLVTINDQAENEWLFATFGTIERWIGLTDHGSVSSEGNWVWISGEPVTFTSWDFYQPDNEEGGEDCAHLNHDNHPPGVWNDLGNLYLPWHPDLPLFGIIEALELTTPTEPSNWGTLKALYR